ncbi:hypothetical protein ACTFIZ_002288 [Dictyostelium cf. discoideum]
MSSMLSPDNHNVDLELIRYLAESAIVLAVNAQASLSRVRRNNIAKEIYGSEVLLPIKIKDTPKMFDETETERVRKLAKSIKEFNNLKKEFEGENIVAIPIEQDNNTPIDIEKVRAMKHVALMKRNLCLIYRIPCC